MVSDGHGRPLNFFLSPGQMSDAKGALALLRDLPPASTLLADKGYDPAYGARPLRRLIQQAIGDTLARKLLAGPPLMRETLAAADWDLRAVLAAAG